MTLKMKDLSVSKELDGKAMSAVHGGLQSSNLGNWAGGAVAVSTGGGIGDVTMALNLPAQVIVNTPVNLELPIAVAVLGQAVAV